MRIRSFGPIQDEVLELRDKVDALVAQSQAQRELIQLLSHAALRKTNERQFFIALVRQIATNYENDETVERGASWHVPHVCDAMRVAAGTLDRIKPPILSDDNAEQMLLGWVKSIGLQVRHLYVAFLERHPEDIGILAGLERVVEQLAAAEGTADMAARSNLEQNIAAIRGAVVAG